MGSVDRADYMDNIKVAEVEQTIQKEKEYVLSDMYDALCQTQLCSQFPCWMRQAMLQATEAVLPAAREAGKDPVAPAHTP